MLFQGSVAQALAAVRQSGQQNVTQGWLGELLVSEVMPRYMALAQSGLLYTARCALQPTSLASAASLVGLQLYNPTTTKNLVLTKTGGNIVVTSSTETGLALAFGSQGTTPPTAQTPATSAQNNMLGGGGPSGLALSVGTFANAPVAAIDLLHNSAAIAGTGEDAGYSIDLEGSVVVGPGKFVAIVALGAAGAAASNNHWIQWFEAPV
jgi:hypothetical protein